MGSSLTVEGPVKLKEAPRGEEACQAEAEGKHVVRVARLQQQAGLESEGGPKTRASERLALQNLRPGMGKKTFWKARKVSQLVEAAKLSRQTGTWAGRVASYPNFLRDSVRRPL